VLNRFGAYGDDGARPVRQTGDRQRISGKLRQKFMSGPSLRRISGQPSPKRLSTLGVELAFERLIQRHQLDEVGPRQLSHQRCDNLRAILGPLFLQDVLPDAPAYVPVQGSEPRIHRPLAVNPPPSAAVGR